MNLLNPGIQYFSLHNASGDNVVLDGNFIGPGSTLAREQVNRMGARGGIVKVNDRWNLELSFAEKIAEIEALPSGTYNLSIVKLNGFVFWNEDQRFSVNDSVLFDPTSEDFPHSITMQDIRGEADIRQVINAASPWRDADADGVADFYEKSAAGVTASFTDGVQTIGHTSDFHLQKNLVLPFPGLKLHFAVTFDVLHDDGTNQIRLRFRDSAGAILSSVSEDATVTGRVSLEATIPANAFSVDVQVINVTGVTANTTSAQIKEPTLRIDNTDWINA